jgi:nickel-dependent lactate racemase
MRVTLRSGQMEQSVDIPDGNLIGVVQPAVQAEGQLDTAEVIIREAVENPIGAQPLEALLSAASRVAIVVDDITRPTPTREILAVLLDELRRAGVSPGNTTITIACGLHRKPTREDKLAILGEEILSRYAVAASDARDEKSFYHLGTTSRGTPLYVNKRVREADLILTAGVIKSHAFAGFTGGAKSILPGISSRETILTNHRYEFVDYPHGILGDADACLARQDMEEAAGRLPVFIVNAVRDVRGRVAGAFAGDVVQAHRAGVALFRKMAERFVAEKADVVLLEGGYSSRMHLYQAIGSIDATISTRSPVVKDGGLVVLHAECREGMGADLFERVFARFETPQAILQHLRSVPPQDDQWSVQRLAFFLTRIRIALVSTGLGAAALQKIGMGHYATLQQALEAGLRDYGSAARVLVIKNPDFLILNAR